jgi:hypothetical protein
VPAEPPELLCHHGAVKGEASRVCVIGVARRWRGRQSSKHISRILRRVEQPTIQAKYNSKSLPKKHVEVVLQEIDQNAGRAFITNEGETLKLVIPVVTPLGSKIFLFCWWGGWLMGEVAVTKEIFFSTTPWSKSYFAIIWLCVWTVIGVKTLRSFLWSLFGREIIKLNQQYLTHQMSILNVGTTSKFAVTHITNMRYAAPEISQKTNRNSGLFPPKVIKFDFGMTTHYVGMGLDQPEANAIIEQMSEKVRSLKAPS